MAATLNTISRYLLGLGERIFLVLIILASPIVLLLFGPYWLITGRSAMDDWEDKVFKRFIPR